MGTNQSGVRHLWHGALVLACALCLPLLTSCSETPPSPLRLASSPWPGYEPIYLAREIGYLPKEQANIFELPSSDITLESFRNRSTDMATLTLDEVFELLHGGIKLRVLVVLDSSYGADAVMATPRVKKLSDLKGKRIVIQNIPLGVYMLSRLLEKAGLTREDVHILNAPESKHEEMYRQGKADAFITFEPVKTKLAAMGAHVIFDTRDIPNEIFDLLVVHEDVYQQRRAEVCNVARQWYRTLEFMKASPDEAAVRIGKRLGVKPQEFIAMLGGIKTPTRQENLQLLGGEHPAIAGAAAKLSAVMLHDGQLVHPVDITAALDAQLHTCIPD